MKYIMGIIVALISVIGGVPLIDSYIASAQMKNANDWTLTCEEIEEVEPALEVGNNHIIPGTINLVVICELTSVAMTLYQHWGEGTYIIVGDDHAPGYFTMATVDSNPSAQWPSVPEFGSYALGGFNQPSLESVYINDDLQNGLLLEMMTGLTLTTSYVHTVSERNYTVINTVSLNGFPELWSELNARMDAHSAR